MPQSRASLARQRKSEILEAALQVFSRKGFHRATNRDIAQAAGIASPGLIYHYFRDKNDLLAQLLERMNPALQVVTSPGEFQSLPLRQGLLQFARGFAEVAGDPHRAATLRLFLSEALQDPTTASAIFNSGPKRALGILAIWLQRHIDEGKLRRENSALLAQQFIAPLLMDTLFSVLFGQMGSVCFEVWVDLFLAGAALPTDE